ncbi:MAG: hypothetical protein ACN4GR_00055 [Arenicellales bacterium]
MKAVITKQQFIDKIGPEKRKSLEQRLGIDLSSDIMIEEIYEIIKRDFDSGNEELDAFERKFGGGNSDE